MDSEQFRGGGGGIWRIIPGRNVSRKWLITMVIVNPQVLGFFPFNMCQGLNSHYFHIIGDGHQPNSRGLYTHEIRIPIKGGMTIPNIATFDHGTNGLFMA